MEISVMLRHQANTTISCARPVEFVIRQLRILAFIMR